jgi:hypothetical protein
VDRSWGNWEGSEFLRRTGRGERMSRRATAEWRYGLLPYGLRCLGVLGPATGCSRNGRGRAGDAGTVNALDGLGRGLDEVAADSSWCSRRKIALKTDL